MHNTRPAPITLLRALTIATGISTLPAATSAADTTEVTPRFLEAVGDEGPWHEPRSEFNAFLSKTPNITGDYAISGPNISLPAKPSSYHPIDGWSWSIVLAADIPLANSSTAPGPDDDGEGGPFYYTGGKMVLNAPSGSSSNGGNLTVQDGWELCLYRWELREVAYPSELRSDDGTCTSVLSDECIAGMKKAALPSQNHDCQCPQMSEIPSCRSLGGASTVFDTTCSGTYYDAKRLRTWTDGKLETWAFGGDETHHAGNTTAYNEIGTIAWPVMTSFGDGAGYNAASLACVRAKDTVGDSAEPSYEQGSGNMLGVSWAGMGAAIFTAYVLIL